MDSEQTTNICTFEAFESRNPRFGLGYYSCSHKKGSHPFGRYDLMREWIMFPELDVVDEAEMKSEQEKVAASSAGAGVAWRKAEMEGGGRSFSMIPNT